MNAIGTVLSGIRAATLRLDASANNIANANSTGPTPAATNQSGAQVYQSLSVQQSPLHNGGVSAQVVPSKTRSAHL